MLTRPARPCASGIAGWLMKSSVTRSATAVASWRLKAAMHRSIRARWVFMGLSSVVGWISLTVDLGRAVPQQLVSGIGRRLEAGHRARRDRDDHNPVRGNRRRQRALMR